MSKIVRFGGSLT